MYDTFTPASTGLVPIIYRRFLASTLPNSSYQLQRSGTQQYSTCKSYSQKHKRPNYQIQKSSTENTSHVLLSKLMHVIYILTCLKKPSAYQLQRNTTEPNSTCKSYSHYWELLLKISYPQSQQAYCLSEIEESYWALQHIIIFSKPTKAQKLSVIRERWWVTFFMQDTFS
jgi:hypothetical protein